MDPIEPMDPMQLLYERGEGPVVGLPAALERLYGGTLSLGRPGLYANFVQSLDGVVAIRSVRSPGSMIALHSQADRLVMGLLRGCAEAVLVGGTTFREAPQHRWTAAGIYPPLAPVFADLRRGLGLAPEPLLAVMTASGVVPASHAGLRGGALILTSETGAARAGPVLPDSCRLEVLPTTGPQGGLDVAAVLAALRSYGCGSILSEAGPTITGQLLAQDLIDEVFVTLSPVVVGGGRDDAAGLAGQDPLPRWAEAGTLAGIRRHGSHLFLRYRRHAGAGPVGPAWEA